MGNRSGDGRRPAVTSLVELRAKLQSPARQSLQVIRGSLRNDPRPLGDRCSADVQRARDMDRLLEMGDDVTLEHGSMLTIVTNAVQPYSPKASLTLVSMEPWDSDLFEQRLAWSLAKAKVTQSALADHCGVSTAAVSKWMNGHTKDLKMDNIFAAAELCAVSARWLGTNKGTPLDGINAAFAGISGADIQIAKRLSEVEDRGLRGTIIELISAKESAKQARRKNPKRT